MTIAIAPPRSGLQDYIDWLSLNFTISVLQPDEDLAKYQGLVLTGGADIGKQPERDRIEKIYIDRALVLGIPVLAICRGMQLVNLHLGGTLIEDIHESICQHGLDRELLSIEGMRISHMPSSYHEVIMPEQTILVNSRHHQAIDKLAPGFTVTGVSPDGIIEMVENEQFIMVQWHPEREEVRGKFCSTMVVEKFKRLLS